MNINLRIGPRFACLVRNLVKLSNGVKQDKDSMSAKRKNIMKNIQNCIYTDLYKVNSSISGRRKND